MSHLTLTEASQGEQQARQPPLNWQKSSAQKEVSQLTEKEERIVTATIHFLRTESDICSLLHLAVSTVMYVTKSLPWGGASIFSWSRDWPFLVSVNCDVPEAYNFEFGVICFWMYWKTVLWIMIEIHSVLWNVNCQNPLYCTHLTLKMNIEDIKSLIWPNDLN